MTPKPKSLRFLKSQISRIENKTKNLTILSIYSVQHFLGELEEFYSEFSKYYESDELSEIAEKEFEEYDDKYQTARSLLMERLDEVLNRTPGETLNVSGVTDKTIAGLLERQNELVGVLNKISSEGSKREGNRLPYLKIPVFDGNLKEWIKFKNLFSSIVDSNKHLSDVEKLNHLLTLLEGDPLSLIKHYPVAGEHYKNAWATVLKEYDNNYVLIRSLISEVSNLPHLDHKQGNIRALNNVLLETINSLDNSGEYGKSRDPWVMFMVTSKFDKETARKWAEVITDDPEPSVETLMTFLGEICSANKIIGFDTCMKSSAPIRKMNAIVSDCFVCHGSHKIFQCSRFMKLPVKERETIVKNQSRCINCLGLGHFSSSCHHKGSCFHCRKRHHSLLHFDSFAKLSNKNDSKSVGGKVENEKTEVDEKLVRVHSAFDHRVTSAILPTAVIQIQNAQGNYVKCRVLLDSGAQASFVREKFAKSLQLVSHRTRVPILFMSGSTSFVSKGSIRSVYRSCSGVACQAFIDLHILPKLTDKLPDHPLRLKSSDHLRKKFVLADPLFDEPGEIDVIIGADHFFSLIGPGKYFHADDNLYILESRLGWLISGGSSTIDGGLVSFNNVSKPEIIDDMVSKFWEVEESCAQNSITEQDLRCEQIFTQRTVRVEKGRYSVDLPMKEPKVEWGDSYRGAFNRFMSLEKKFKRDPDYSEKYHDAMSLFEKEGFIELVPKEELHIPVSERFYLAHYGIYRCNNKEKKLRIVFDASAKSENGVSLNDSMMIGPKFQTDIFQILLGFRLHKYVFTTDIVKMYRQICINDSHRNYQRIFWRKSDSKIVQEFRLTTLMDGVNAAPYLALRVINQLASDESENYPRGAKALANRYMDDIFVGHDDINELKAIREELVGILRSAGMELDKWSSNDSNVLIGVSEDEKQSDPEIQFDTHQVIKTLGVSWYHENDEFSFSNSCSDLRVFSKRTLLSESARIYDPCGWISPTTILLKSLFQKTWLSKIEWDDPLPESISVEWRKLRDKLNSLADIRIPRWIGGRGNVELHGFCDSSTTAYSAVVYLRVSCESGSRITRLLASKAKLCPLRSMSIARLELCGAHLLARLINELRSVFGDLNPTYHCWSDSKTVLAWLASHPSRWKSFVANRCSHVMELLPDIAWRYVKSEDNPADVASRGCPPDKLVCNRLWWTGPPWINDDWQSHFGIEVFDSVEEQRPIHLCNANLITPFFIRFVENFSCYDRFRRAFCYLVTFFNYLKDRSKFQPEPLSAEKISNSTALFLKLAQQHYFPADYTYISERKSLPKSSKFCRLSPFIDEAGLFRIGGRLSSEYFDFDTCHPIVIPRCHFLTILIRYIHEKYYHSGLKLTVALLKQSHYVFRMRSLVKSVISNCVVCKRLKGKTYEPLMSSLPEMRVKFVKPFENTGIDFAGPVLIRPYIGKGNLTRKGYICVMVCMVTRAVHLELVSSLSTQSLILALKRFISRYGHCRVLISNNGRNFVGCAKQLKELEKIIFASVKGADVKSFLLSSLMDWKFIPAYSPNFGGLWEAAVKSAKYHLSRVFHGKTPTIEEMTTALSEITAILNSRPISALTDNEDDFGILTPSHLISGHSATCLPLMITPSNKKSSDGRYGKIGSLISLFWKHWRNEYVQDYMKRVKWHRPGKTPEIGDLVLLKRPNEPPAHWSLGRIVKLYLGESEEVRTVDVKTESGIRRESSRNLVPLILKHEASMGGVCTSRQ